MSTISAGTTSGTALVSSGDTTGELVFKTNGTTTALTLGTDQSATFAGNVVVSGSIAVPSPFAITGNSTAGAEIRLPEDTDNGSNYVAIKAPDSLASNLTFTLPSTDGTTGQLLQTNGSGTLSFTSVPPGGVTTFTSSGSITAGQPVYMNTDGTVSTATLQSFSNNSGDVSATAMYASSYPNAAIAYDEVNDKYICVWFSNSTTIAYSFGTLNTSTGAVTWANQSTVAAGATANSTSPTIKLYIHNGVGAIAFNNSSGYAYAKFFSSTGSALTFGSTISLYTDVAAYSTSVLDFTLKYDTFCDKWIAGVCGLNSAGDSTYYFAATVNLTGLNPATANTVSRTSAVGPTSTTSYQVSVYHDPASGMIIFRPGQTQSTASIYFYTAVFNASGAPSIGSGYGFLESGFSLYNSIGFYPVLKDQVTGTQYMFVARAGGSPFGYYILDRAGNTLATQLPNPSYSIGPPYFYSSTTSFWSGVYGACAYNKFTNTFAIYSTVSSNYSHCFTGEFRNGGAISFSAPNLTFLSGYVLETQPVPMANEQAGHPSGWMVFAAKRSSVPAYVAVRSVAQTKTRYVGIAASTVSTGQSVTVTVAGGVNTNQSGLSVGEPYYLNGTTITTTPGATNLIGYATSATSLLLV